jgi:hypothetical protein
MKEKPIPPLTEETRVCPVCKEAQSDVRYNAIYQMNLCALCIDRLTGIGSGIERQVRTAITKLGEAQAALEKILEPVKRP